MAIITRYFNNGLVCTSLLLLSACSDPTLYFTAKERKNLQTQQALQENAVSQYQYCDHCVQPTPFQLVTTKGDTHVQ